jgi:hypothetical protein
VTFSNRTRTVGPAPRKELIEGAQFGPPVSTLEYNDLLTKCEVLHEQVSPGSKEPEDRSTSEEDKAEHREQLSQIGGLRKLCKLLILRGDAVLARHRLEPIPPFKATAKLGEFRSRFDLQRCW